MAGWSLVSVPLEFRSTATEDTSLHSHQVVLNTVLSSYPVCPSEVLIIRAFNVRSFDVQQEKLSCVLAKEQSENGRSRFSILQI